MMLLKKKLVSDPISAVNQLSVKMDDKESSDNSSKINKFHNPNFREPKNTVAMGISLFGAKLSQMTR